ncbi:putative DNA modification/repair radical SAM protein [Malaciobacter mytili LMG 24559]|uniref:DNA modification/repair radical SAM protein n=1 Tax=Malaciobacter mytili LMG 24559 TaxID=1032238 RepID=A0AAX2ACW5_9BACT|nr:putative DNA modification/repair radical SAM protein [Malaciobacter mytili]AXH14929.1 putative DNA modification/repair radical SAM protein [Malaciobacter mytili LMG 24559]RXK14857.1 putative DNA modification/repair radical SAM protein [Malaciobacter mytili LMG 24559]
MKKDIYEKMQILADSAKYDVSCSSSGSENNYKTGQLGATHNSGICHTFTADGRCVSLLKVLLTNFCIYDCAYCINRKSNDIKRAAFSPRQLADITINFYKRNYIEGLFLSSGIIENEDHTMLLILRTLKILRQEYFFNGYIHVKLIPGADERLIEQVVNLANRVSSNIELPSDKSLKLLAPNKSKEKVLQPLKYARDISLQKDIKPIGMSTQLIVGATPESDKDILKLSSVLYDKALLKRVYYSAYIPVNDDKNLPSLINKPPLLREHRLYQADWLLRFYDFKYDEIVNDEFPNLDEEVDPKTFWALQNLQYFPMEINKVSKEELLRIPGIGVRGVFKILKARKFKSLDFEDLKKLKISLKKAQYFITCKGKYHSKIAFYKDNIKQAIIQPPKKKIIQPSLFDMDYSTIIGEI